MWTKFETQFIGKMFGNTEDKKLEDLLPSNLIDVIKGEGGLAYENLRYNCPFCTFVTFCLEIIISYRNTICPSKLYDLFDL